MPGRSFNSSEYRYGHNTQEKVDEISGSGNHYTAMFWEYDPRLIRRWNPDPKPDAWESVYAAYAGNPIFHSDILGDTEDERKKAVEKAKEYKEENPGKSYKLGAKGEPGSSVDCSGLVSGCVKASGLSDPNSGDASKGTTNIKNNTTPVSDINQLQEGNGIFIDFSGKGGTGHTGIISSVTKNDAGEVTGYSFIHSGSTNGPTEDKVTIGKNSYYSDKVSGFYKWDTPDKPALTNGNSNSVKETVTLFNPYTNQTLIIPKPKEYYFKAAAPQTYGQQLQQSSTPAVKAIGSILNYFGY